MQGQLQWFEVTGLHGKTNTHASFRDNNLILVGENGSGKTTFLRLLYAILSGRLSLLGQYTFTTIRLKIDDMEFSFTKEEVSKGVAQWDNRRLAVDPLLRDLPSASRRRILDLADQGDFPRMRDEVLRLEHRYGIPAASLLNRLSVLQRSGNSELREKLEGVRKQIGAQIVYLPTYRRIERELGSIIEGVEIDEIRARQGRERDSDASYIELVEFGMRDVAAAIDRNLLELKEFARVRLTRLTLGYLSSVVNREYMSVDDAPSATLTGEVLQQVLGRLPEDILSETDRRKLALTITEVPPSGAAQNEQYRILRHYIRKLQEFQAELENKEAGMTAFTRLCNQYVSGKQFRYASSTFSMSITESESSDRTIRLEDLSSGEKQIVSLFSHLYLAGKARYFVIIDEPELSLSVAWQKKFLLDIRGGAFCQGLVAATHSPFVFENELESYAHALGEFGTK